MLMVLFAFVPFFAITEMGRVLGEGRLGALFFKRRDTANIDLIVPIKLFP